MYIQKAPFYIHKQLIQYIEQSPFLHEQEFPVVHLALPTIQEAPFYI